MDRNAALVVRNPVDRPAVPALEKDAPVPNLVLRLSDSEDGGPVEAARPVMDRDAALTLLRESEITAAELVPWGSNYTFGVALTTATGREHLGIYKPKAGEAPLHDFPSGTLYRREQASFLLSQRLGWDIVPPTVVRDGPHGVGSLQLYIEPNVDLADSTGYWMQPVREIERLVLFDHVANNADRKIGHCLLDQTGKVWGIDHGLTFNHVPKLRTVLWQFIGQPVDTDLLCGLQTLLDDEGEVRLELSEWLAANELDALLRRVRAFVDDPVYPGLSPRRNVPYGWW